MHKYGYFSKNKNFCKLIQKIAEGKKSALRDFYVLFGKSIYSIALSVCKNHEKADEAVNDVLLKVWDRADRLINYENPDGWIYRVTVNAATDKLRNENWLPLHDYLPYENDDLQIIEDIDTFYGYTKTLSKNESDVMILRFVNDLTFDVIASVTGQQVSMVTALYYRALKKIKRNVLKKQKR